MSFWKFQLLSLDPNVSIAVGTLEVVYLLIFFQQCVCVCEALSETMGYPLNDPFMILCWESLQISHGVLLGMRISFAWSQWSLHFQLHFELWISSCGWGSMGWGSCVVESWLMTIIFRMSAPMLHKCKDSRLNYRWRVYSLCLKRAQHWECWWHENGYFTGNMKLSSGWGSCLWRACLSNKERSIRFN